MSNLSDKVILSYFQSWGQSVEERLGILNEAVEAAGISAICTGKEINGELVARWIGKDQSELKRAVRFREELEGCFPLGKFEEESAAIERLINNYVSQL